MTNFSNHLNGWQRIGVALTIVWIVCAGTFFGIKNNQIAHNSANVIFDLCITTTSNPDADRQKQCKSEREEFYENTISESLTGVAFVTLVPVPVFWILGYLLTITFRWIKRGFSVK